MVKSRKPDVQTEFPWEPLSNIWVPLSKGCIVTVHQSYLHSQHHVSNWINKSQIEKLYLLQHMKRVCFRMEVITVHQHQECKIIHSWNVLEALEQNQYFPTELTPVFFCLLKIFCTSELKLVLVNKSFVLMVFVFRASQNHCSGYTFLLVLSEATLHCLHLFFNLFFAEEI